MTDIISNIKDQLTEAGVEEPSLSANYLLSCCLSARVPHVPVLARDWEKQSHTCLTDSKHCYNAGCPTSLYNTLWEIGTLETSLSSADLQSSFPGQRPSSWSTLSKTIC